MPILELTEEQVLALLKQLPEAQKQRLLAQLSGTAETEKRRMFGSAKDDIIYMAPDFDAPLEDFKDSM